MESNDQLLCLLTVASLDRLDHISPNLLPSLTTSQQPSLNIVLQTYNTSFQPFYGGGDETSLGNIEHPLLSTPVQAEGSKLSTSIDHHQPLLTITKSRSSTINHLVFNHQLLNQLPIIHEPTRIHQPIFTFSCLATTPRDRHRWCHPPLTVPPRQAKHSDYVRRAEAEAAELGGQLQRWQAEHAQARGRGASSVRCHLFVARVTIPTWWFD